MVPPRILITGANGLVGQALVRGLSAWPGADVLATGRQPASPVSVFSGGYVPLDVLDTDAVERVMQDFAPSVVVHAAAISQVEACEADKEACWALNVDATAALAAACYRHGSRMVLLSSDFVFDGRSGPYAEDDRPFPLNAYGRSKLAAENALRLSRLTDWAVARTTLVFDVAEGDARLNLVTWLLRELAAGNPVRVASDQTRTATYAPDLADGIARLIRHQRAGTYHLAGRESLAILNMAHTVAEVFELDPSLISPARTAELHPGAPRPLDAGLLILRAESELGYRPRCLRDALRHLRDRIEAKALTEPPGSS
ncbi:MAG: dTDP-4-dehydrorhamnose reductase [Rubricoccaceae bacterium]